MVSLTETGSFGSRPRVTSAGGPVAKPGAGARMANAWKGSSGVTKVAAIGTTAALVTAGAVAYIVKQFGNAAGGTELLPPTSPHNLYVADNRTNILSPANHNALVLSEGSPENINLEMTKIHLPEWSIEETLSKNLTALDANADKMVNATELQAANLTDGLYLVKVRLQDANGTLLNQTLQDQYVVTKEFGFLLDTKAPDMRIGAVDPKTLGKYKRADGTPFVYTNATEWDIDLSDATSGLLYAEITNTFNGNSTVANKTFAADPGKCIGNLTESGCDFIGRGPADAKLKGALVMNAEGEYKLLVKGQDVGEMIAELSLEVVNDKTAPTGMFTFYDPGNVGWHNDNRVRLALNGTGSPIEDATLFVNGHSVNIMEKLELFGRTVGEGIPVDNYIPELGMAILANDDGTWDFHFDDDGKYDISVMYKDAAGNTNITTEQYWLDRVGPSLTDIHVKDGFLYANVTDQSGIGQYFFKVRENNTLLVGTGPEPVVITDGRTHEQLSVNLTQYGLKAGQVLEINAVDVQGNWRTFIHHLTEGDMGNATYKPPVTAFDQQPPTNGDSYNNGNYQQNSKPTAQDYCEPSNDWESAGCT